MKKYFLIFAFLVFYLSSANAETAVAQFDGQSLSGLQIRSYLIGTKNDDANNWSGVEFSGVLSLNGELEGNINLNIAGNLQFMVPINNVNGVYSARTPAVLGGSFIRNGSEVCTLLDSGIIAMMAIDSNNKVDLTLESNASSQLLCNGLLQNGPKLLNQSWTQSTYLVAN